MNLLNQSMRQLYEGSMPQEYFSDRKNGPRPRVIEDVSPTVWYGIRSLYSRLCNDESFGNSFPFICRSGPDNGGCNTDLLDWTLKAEIPDITLPLISQPPTSVILDLIEFCYKYVAKEAVA